MRTTSSLVGQQKAGGWNDWALFSNREGEEVTAGQIFGFIILTPTEINIYNKSTRGKRFPINESKTNVTFAIVQMTKAPLKGFLDPSQSPIEAQCMQSNSRLLFWEEKGEHSYSILRPVAHIRGPVLAYGDFDPWFKMGSDGSRNKHMQLEQWYNSENSNDAFIFVRPRHMWADVFLTRAREHLLA